MTQGCVALQEPAELVQSEPPDDMFDSSPLQVEDVPQDMVVEVGVHRGLGLSRGDGSYRTLSFDSVLF